MYGSGHNTHVPQLMYKNSFYFYLHYYQYQQEDRSTVGSELTPPLDDGASLTSQVKETGDDGYGMYAYIMLGTSG